MDKGYAFHFSKQNKVFTWSEKKIKETENAPAQKLKKDERLKVIVYIFLVIFSLRYYKSRREWLHRYGMVSFIIIS